MGVYIPEGKTRVRLKSDVNQSVLKKDDTGYIDAYCRGADDRPYAVFVRERDGEIDMVPINQLRVRF